MRIPEFYIMEFVLLHTLAVIIVGGWVGAWLNWTFVGHIRHYALALLPEKIRGISRETLASMTHDELATYIICDLNVPEFIRRLLTCSTCLSFHCAWTGFAAWLVVLHQSAILISIAHIAWTGLLVIPASAALGLFIHSRTNS
jgi:hypothetical protein